MNKKILKIIVGLVLVSGFVFLILHSTKCSGSECGIEVVNEKASTLNPQNISNQVENNEIFLLDVREDYEWVEGHIKGAKHISLNNLNAETTQNISKEIPLYIYCRSGRRAEEAELKLRELGFEKAKSIGGIIEWQEKGGILVTQ